MSQKIRVCEVIFPLWEPELGHASIKGTFRYPCSWSVEERDAWIGKFQKAKLHFLLCEKPHLCIPHPDHDYTKSACAVGMEYIEGPPNMTRPKICNGCRDKLNMR